MQQYNFSSEEIESLCLLFRKNESSLPIELDSLKFWLEQKIYEVMSISEAEEFFNEEI